MEEKVVSYIVDYLKNNPPKFKSDDEYRKELYCFILDVEDKFDIKIPQKVLNNIKKSCDVVDYLLYLMSGIDKENKFIPLKLWEI